MRFNVIQGSQSKHCCFEASVVDAKRQNEAVCECFEMKDAEIIAAALNDYANREEIDL